MGLLSGNGWAFSEDVERTGDTELATIAVVKDGEMEVQRKLGSTPCARPSSNSETISYFYRTTEGSYLRFIVNETPSDVDYRLVESMTMSLEPIAPEVCYGSIDGLLNGHSATVGTGKGLHLGDSIKKVTRLYGEPKEKFLDGPGIIRLRYDWDRELDHYYQWSLIFRDDQLVQWTVEAIPFFIEVSG